MKEEYVEEISKIYREEPQPQIIDMNFLFREISEVFAVMQAGSNKEGRKVGDWRKFNSDHFIEKAERHINKAKSEKMNDHEFELPHLAHAIADLYYALHRMREEKQLKKE